MAMDFNPYLPELRADPYPFYHQLRSEDPVHRSALGAWFVSRYADAHALLRDRRLGRDFSTFLDAQMGELPVRRMLAKTLLYLDPPDHTRIRTLVSKAFTPRVVESMGPRIQAIVDELLDVVAPAGAMDVVADLAAPLPVRVISEIVGIPREDEALLWKWSRDFFAVLEFVLPPEIIERADNSARESAAYLHELIRQRRAHPTNDLLTRLLEAEEQGQRLTEEEIISTCIILFSAGHETTAGLIGNGILSLLRNPDQLTRLKTDPQLIRQAILEFLRYEPSVHMTSRMAMDAVEIDGRTIPAGEAVIILLGAANRDPARFADPDVLDIGRLDNEPLTFGGGIHHCLGNALGRLEAEIAIGTLVRRFPALRFANSDAPTWHDTVSVRGLKSLQARF